MKTNIVDQAKRLVVLLTEFDELDDDDQDKIAFLIGARLLSIDSELRAIGRYIDPSWRDEGGLAWNLNREGGSCSDDEGSTRHPDVGAGRRNICSSRPGEAASDCCSCDPRCVRL